MDIAGKSPAVLSLCSGYGGLEIGIKRVYGEISILAHVEIEAFAIANMVNKMEAGLMVPAPIWTDLKTFKAGIFRGLVDILTGGYPCQPFSAAGKRNGTEDARHLWPYVRETIRACEPRRVFLENVEGHLSLGICEVLADLEKMGYRVAAGIFSAAEVGAPHQRKRVFILAEFIDRNVDLAHAINRGRQNRRPLCNGKIEGRDIQNHRPETPELCNFPPQNRWSARPGQPQYEWEEPRVVADTQDTDRGAGKEEIEGRQGQRRGMPANQGKRQTEPQLGRVLDGNTHRVDRLRLLGNGVVPATAEKAYRTLSEELA